MLVLRKADIIRMMEPGDIIDDYLDGKNIEPCEYSEYEIEKLEEFLGEDEY